MSECEESGCTRAATKDWNGRPVCSDHHDAYREEEEKSIMRLSNS